MSLAVVEQASTPLWFWQSLLAKLASIISAFVTGGLRHYLGSSQGLMLRYGMAHSRYCGRQAVEPGAGCAGFDREASVAGRLRLPPHCVAQHAPSRAACPGQTAPACQPHVCMLSTCVLKHASSCPLLRGVITAACLMRHRQQA